MPFPDPLLVAPFDSPLATMLAIFRAVVTRLQPLLAVVVAVWNFPFMPTSLQFWLVAISILRAVATLLQPLLAVVVAVWNFPFMPTSLQFWLVAIFILREVATLLQPLLAVVVAVWNFPFIPTPLQFWLVVMVSFINFRLVATPLHFLMTEWAVISNSRLDSHPLREGADSDSEYSFCSCSEGSESDISCCTCWSDVPEEGTYFRLFKKLPLELRRMIWRYTLPCRVVELNIPEFSVRPQGCTFDWTSKANNQAPTVAMLMREARELAVWYCTLKSDMQRAKDLQRVLRSPDTPCEGLWIRSDHPLVRPEGRVTWFNKANDTVLLYHSPYWESRSAWNALTARIALYGFLAADTAVFASQVNPWPRRSDLHQMFGMASGPHVPWIDPIFVLRIVVIHAAVEEAQHSGLFGLAGDEPIQLVDPLDTNLLMEFFWFTRSVYREQTGDTVAFFDSLRANVGAWEAQVQAWRRDGLTRDLWTAWMAECEHDFAGIDNPGGVFTGPRWRNGIALDMTDPASYQTSAIGGPIDLDQYGPDESHPWVEDFLARLPNFRPRIQIRHCADRCVPIPEEDES